MSKTLINRMTPSLLLMLFVAALSTLVLSWFAPTEEYQEYKEYDETYTAAHSVLGDDVLAVTIQNSPQTVVRLARRCFWERWFFQHWHS